jgi:AcrR family transcriptional regulator
MTTPAVGPLQQRIRDRMRAEVAAAAVDLFLAKGFDETTVDEICAGVGLSRRSFFRYFRGKEDAVVSEFTAVAEDGCRAFVARPPDEDVWTALRRGMDPFVAWVDADRDRAGALLRLVEQSPTLRASYLDRIDSWRASLAVVLRARLGTADPNDLGVAVIAAACIGAYVAASRQWAVSSNADSPSATFDEAFGILAPNTLPTRRNRRRTQGTQATTASDGQ